MALWTPALITTSGWWDCSDTGTITPPGSGRVSQVNDKSGNSRHLVQATESEQFLTGSRTLNGLNVLDGDGDRFMEVSSFPVASSGDLMVIAMATLDVINSVSDCVYCMDAASADWQLESNHASQFNGRLNNSSFTSALSGGPFAGPSSYGTVFNYTAGTAKVFIDGIERASYSSYTTKVGASQLLQIFANRTGAFNPDGAFAELIVLDAVDTTTRQLIEGYINWKWGQQAKLDAGHLYKDAAPTDGASGNPYYYFRQQ